MSDRLPRRLPLSPRARKLVAFGSLIVGVLVVGRVLAPVAPRDVEVRVRLANLREPPSVARSLDVSFERHGDVVRSLSTRFGPSGPPLEWRGSVSLARGEYDAVSTVELDGRVVSRRARVTVEAGEPVNVLAPLPDGP